MRKLAVYFLIAILIFSQNPSLIHAAVVEDTETEKDVVLFAENIDEEIEAYSNIESIEMEEYDYLIPDETEATWLTEKETIEQDGIEYSLILFVEEDAVEDEWQEVYVDHTTIVLLEEVDTFKSERLQEVEEEVDVSEEATTEEVVETDSVEQEVNDNDPIIEEETDEATEPTDESTTETNIEEETTTDNETSTLTDDVKSNEDEEALEQDEEQVEQEEEATIQTYRTMSSSRSLALVLQNGMRHANVKKLKTDLKKLGFQVPGNGTTLFGKQTEQKVREFQRYYGLSADGKADVITLAKISSIVNSPLQKGKRHNNTKTLKRDLKAINYPVPGNGTTLYGVQTENVVKKFQRDKKLVVNGIADEKTLAKIAELRKSSNNSSNSVPSVLESGMRHAMVKTLKADLKKLGFAVPGNGTTLYGSQTERKVREFQNYYGISVDGKAGTLTLNKVASILNTPLQRGKRHNNTKTLKRDLKAINYPVPGNGTNLYGVQTENVVKKFQRENKLVVNGIADEKTLAKIAELRKSSNVTPTVLENGVRHATVKALKADLKKLGFRVPGNGTTLYGKQTENKVRDFQRYYGLSADGKAGKQTLDKIASILNTPLQKGKRHNNTKQLKADLKTAGYPVPGNGTTLYGAQTERMVKKFQQDNKLIATGIADEVTLDKLANAIKNQKTVKIFIDPGHGGSDPGAVSSGVQEKVMTLDISKRIEKYLSQYRGVEIRMSRTTDTTLTLAQRTNAANNWKADFFFSVHINSGGGHGIESFIYNNKPSQDTINKQIIIHDHITSEVNDRDRGKKRANFHVLRESNMTAMLFEYLFVDTYSDRIKLTKASYRDKLAKATADGIAKAHGLRK